MNSFIFGKINTDFLNYQLLTIYFAFSDYQTESSTLIFNLMRRWKDKWTTKNVLWLAINWNAKNICV